MQLDGATAIVTGTNRGFGHQLAVELLRRGAKVYATARRPELVDIPGAEVLRVDVTDQASVEAAAEIATDVDLLINNAGFTGVGNLVTCDLNTVRRMIDTNYYGTLAMIRAYSPILATNGGGAILNVLSSTAWTSIDSNTSLAAAKSAQWGLTNGVRLELAGQGTLVTALVAGMIGTDTLIDAFADAGVTLPDSAVNDPAELARFALDGIEAGEIEILDKQAVKAKETLSGPPRSLDLTTVATS